MLFTGIPSTLGRRDNTRNLASWTASAQQRVGICPHRQSPAKWPPASSCCLEPLWPTVKASSTEFGVGDSASTCVHSLAAHSWISILRAGSHRFHSRFYTWQTCWGRACTRPPPHRVGRERKATVQLPVNFNLNESQFPVLVLIIAVAASLPLASSFEVSPAVTSVIFSSGHLSQSFMEERSHLGPFKKEDIISQSHICEATDTLLVRAQADLGQALPHHVEESLHCLRDSLFDRLSSEIWMH